MRQRKLRLPLEAWVDPATAFAALYRDDTDVVWLDSGQEATAGFSYIGRAARTVAGDDLPGSILDFLRDDLAEKPLEPDGEGFSLGWLGWLGYELRFETLGLPRTRQSRYPDAAFLFVDRVIEFDHANSRVTLVALGTQWEGELGRWSDGIRTALAAASAPPIPRRPRPTGSDYWRYTDEEYLDMIRACKAAIVEGEAYQLCLTTEFRIEGEPDPFGVYLALRAASPSHHSAFLRIGQTSLLSASPEVFLSVSPTGRIESRPIKGTRARGATEREDNALRDELEGSDKERAENLMIVDLMRNDIGRVSELGSVEVSSLLQVESYAQVHQLVSTVRGQLRADLHGVDAVRACFPAGSMTGAPKRNATLLLDAIEQRARGLYSGAFGYFGLDGRIELAMVIRSIVLDPNGASVGSGGGITALSVPEEELAEVRLKASALLAVLGATD